MLKKLGRVGPLQGRRRRRHSVPHDSRRRHAVVLHARLGPQREGAVQRAARRLRRQHGPSGAQVRDGARATCRSRSSTRSRARRSASSATARRTGRSTRAAISSREETDVEDVVSSAARLSVHRRSLAKFIDAHERVYVVEQNRDAQLLQLMRLELTPERDRKLRSVLHYNGLPIDARSITDDVLAQEGFEVARKTARIVARRA